MGKNIPARSEPDLRGVPSMGVAAEVVSAAPTYSATVVQDSCWISEKVLNSSEAHALRMKRASSSFPAIGWMPSHASCSAPTARHGRGGRHGSETSITAGGGGGATCPGARAPTFPERTPHMASTCSGIAAADLGPRACKHAISLAPRIPMAISHGRVYSTILGGAAKSRPDPVGRGSRVSRHRLSARRRVLATAGHPLDAGTKIAPALDIVWNGGPPVGEPRAQARGEHQG
jgi:hypothetical protein